MYIGYDSMPALFVPVCLSRKTVAILAKKMKAYYDNFAGAPSRLEGSIDLDETVVVFFAKDKEELRRGLASGKDVSFSASGAVVLYSGAYNSGKSAPSSVKAFGRLLGKNIKAMGTAKGNVVSLKAFSHGVTASKLRQRGHFVTVVSQKAVNDANLLVPSTGVSYMVANHFTNKDIASMLNHQRAVAPSTTEHDIESKINWFGMKQRAARRLNNAGMGESMKAFQNQQDQIVPVDFDDFNEDD